MSQSQEKKQVLFVGQQPETVDFSDPALPPGLDAAKIHAGIAVGMQQMAERGWHADERLLNAVHKSAPNASIAFNTAPQDTADAVARCLDGRMKNVHEQEQHMIDISKVGTFTLGARAVKRLGYGAMQLAGPGVFGPPKDRAGALAVLREAVANGVDHIDTSDFYGPHVTNQIIREALHPYPDELVIGTKIGARRSEDGSWHPALSGKELTQAVHDNLRNLGLEVLEVVNLRSMLDVHGPAEGSIEEPLTVLAELQQQGLIRHIGLSNVTAAQVAEGRRLCQIACVQNLYNLAHRADDALIDDLARDGIAYVPFFPLGGFTPLQSTALSDVAGQLGATPMQVALAWLLQRAPNILLIPGTSSVGHLRENLAMVDVVLSSSLVAVLDQIATGVAPA